MSSEYENKMANDLREEASQTFLYTHWIKTCPRPLQPFISKYHHDLSNLSRWSPTINQIWQVVLEKKIFKVSYISVKGKMAPHLAAIFFRYHHDFRNLGRWSPKDYYTKYQ